MSSPENEVFSGAIRLAALANEHIRNGSTVRLYFNADNNITLSSITASRGVLIVEHMGSGSVSLIPYGQVRSIKLDPR